MEVYRGWLYKGVAVYRGWRYIEAGGMSRFDCTDNYPLFLWPMMKIHCPDPKKDDVRM